MNNPDGHATTEDLIDLWYAVLPPDETRRIKEHMADCAFCAQSYGEIACAMKPLARTASDSAEPAQSLAETVTGFLRSISFSPMGREAGGLAFELDFFDSEKMRKRKPDKLRGGTLYNVNISLDKDSYVIAALILPNNKAHIVYPESPSNQILFKAGEVHSFGALIPDIKGDALFDIFQTDARITWDEDIREAGLGNLLQIMSSGIINKNQSQWSYNRVKLIIS